MKDYTGVQLQDEQVKAIVDSYMLERYGGEKQVADVEDIKFALKNYLKRMPTETELRISSNDQGERVWDVIEREVDDEAHYDHQN